MFHDRLKHDGCCNAKGPRGYHCTKEVFSHGGQKIPHQAPHAARAIVGENLGGEIVTWVDVSAPEWNKQYRGR